MIVSIPAWHPEPAWQMKTDENPPSVPTLKIGIQAFTAYNTATSSDNSSNILNPDSPETERQALQRDQQLPMTKAKQVGMMTKVGLLVGCA